MKVSKSKQLDSIQKIYNDAANKVMRKTRLGKPTQTEKAYGALKRAITQGEIEEGSFLSEPEIMKQYGIGRTPYREACQRLHHEGLLQVVPHHGFLVPEMGFHAVCELFEVRLILEDAASQLATARATDQEIDELEKLAVRRLPSEKSQAAFSAFVEANANFHLALANTTRNRRLKELLRQNLESTERLMYIELRTSGFRDTDFRAFHERIVQALRTRDASAVREAVWNDITDGQGATVSFSKMRPPTGLLSGKYGDDRPVKRGRSSGKTGGKS
jgi:DNA-binding GntR family transcriptional regulator